VRVLVVHNRYSGATPSGENVSVDLEVEGLRAAGVEVHRHEVSNDDVLSGGVVEATLGEGAGHSRRPVH